MITDRVPSHNIKFGACCAKSSAATIGPIFRKVRKEKIDYWHRRVHS
jgi:hypothetical protein